MKSRLPIIYTVRRIRSRRFTKSLSNQKANRSLAIAFLSSLLIAFSLSAIGLGFFYTEISKDLPPSDSLPLMMDRHNGSLLSPTILYDRLGTTEIFRLETNNVERRFLPLDPQQPESINPYVVQLVIAVYQPDYWTGAGSSGFSFSNSRSTTIAEKLVEKTLLWNEEQGWKKLIRTRLLADQLIKKFGKAQVLEWFINSLSFGKSTFGIDSAARLYFFKTAGELNLGEAALLVSTSLSPALNPLDAPVAAQENQKKILSQLLKDGLISEADFSTASGFTLKTASNPNPETGIANAFSAMVIEDLKELYGIQRVELGGMSVITTLDYRIQETLQCTLSSQINRYSGLTGENTECDAERFLPVVFTNESTNRNLIASGVVLDPRSGEVLALVGDRDSLGESALITLKQGGSILTPLIAANAFSRGFSPASQVWDLPANETAEILPLEEYHGPIRFRTAMANDYLAGVSDLLNQIDFKIIESSAADFGLKNFEKNVKNSDFLHAGKNVTVLDVADFYQTFATMGQRNGVKNPFSEAIEPKVIRDLSTSDGVIRKNFSVESLSLLSPQLAFLTHDVLSDPLERRESLGFPNLLEIGRPSGAKFGYAENQDEIWTAGYTPQYVSVIWSGSSGGEKAKLDPEITGGVWYAMMQWLHQNTSSQSWQMPTGLTEVKVCDLSGMLPTQDCPTVVEELFIDGNQPVTFDTLFKRIKINRESEKLATVFTPQGVVEDKVFMILPAEAWDWADTHAIPIPPNDYDLIQAPPAPQDAFIQQPFNYQFLSGNIEIIATVQVKDMTGYRIQVGQGLNPTSWFQIGEDMATPVNGEPLIVWDTTLFEDGLYALKLLVVRENYQELEHTIQTTIDNTPPEARILFPTADLVIDKQKEPSVIFQAEITDNIAIDHVEWWLDGKLVMSLTDEPYEISLILEEGEHQVKLVVIDLAGNVTETDFLKFIVK